ncbi:hypothetical protein GCM10027059_01780 [Myceligenerans halotolerans]
MTSGNDTGQGTGSATTKLDDELEKTHVREGASPDSGSSGAVTDPASTENGQDDAKAAETVVNRQDAVEEPSGGTVTERIAAKAEPEAPDAPAEAPAAEASGSAPASARPEAEPRPDPGGFWRSAYEAGTGASSSRYTADSAAGSNGAPESPASSLGSAIDNAAASAKPEPDDIEDTTKPRVVTREALPPSPPGEAWQRVSAPNAREVPTAEPKAATANEATGQSGDGEDMAASVKQGAVKAAQAALAAARNAARKVSSAMPEAPAAETDPQPAPPTPPEMHYAAGAVRGTASVPVEETVPVGSTGRPDGDTTPGPAPGVASRPSAGPRRVRLAISRIDPWSVMKLAFLLSVAIAIMTVVATVVFWSVIDSLGVFDNVQTFVTDAIGEETNFNVMQYVEFERVVSLSTLVAICNVVLLTALATIMTFLYNITAALVGGVHMTLTDD